MAYLPSILGWDSVRFVTLDYPKCQETARVSSCSSDRCTVPLLSCGIQYKDKFMSFGGLINKWRPFISYPGLEDTFKHTEEEVKRRLQPVASTHPRIIDFGVDRLDELEGQNLNFEGLNELILQQDFAGVERGRIEKERMPLRTGKKVVNPLALAQRKQAMAAKRKKGKTEKISPSNVKAYPNLSSTLATSSLALSAPTNRSNNIRSGVPKVSYKRNGDLLVKHREFIIDLPGSVAFAITTININPGLPAVFNWLYRLAQCYSSYIVHNFKVCFETESSTGSTGTVVIAIDYDPSNSAPTTKAQAMAYRGSVRSAPWAPSCHVSLTEDLRKRQSYYVRGGALIPGQDVALFDVGNLFLITQGMASAVVVGEVWIDYEIEFRTPKTLSAGGGNAVWSQFVWTSNSFFVLNQGNLPVSFVTVNGVNFTVTFTFLQPWQGICGMDVVGTGLNIVSGSFSGAAGVSATAQTNAAGTLANGYAVVRANAGQVLTFAATNTTITSGNLYFCQGTGAFN